MEAVMVAIAGGVVVGLMQMANLWYTRHLEKNINHKMDLLLIATSMAEGLAGEKRGKALAVLEADELLATAVKAAKIVLDEAKMEAAKLKGKA